MLLKDGQNVQEHVKNMIELFNELAIVGDNISDEDRVVYLLTSLPESFDVLVTAHRGQLDCSTDGNSNREIAPYRKKAERQRSEFIRCRRSYVAETQEERTAMSSLWQVQSHPNKLS